MRKLFALLMIPLLSFTLIISNAEAAKRFGGGKSFGQQRSNVTQPAGPAGGTTAQRAAPAAGAQKAAGGNRWLGPIAGLLAGTMLGALLFNNGMAGAMMGILMAMLAIGAIFFLVRLLRAKSGNHLQTTPQAPGNTAVPQQFERQQNSAFRSNDFQQQPAGFQPAAAPLSQSVNNDALLREARATFLRMQVAFDNGDLNDIRQFTTPDVFSEVTLQLQERGNVPQQTEIVTMDAELLNLAEENGQLVASVRMHGLIREEAGRPAEAFDEIWHLSRPATAPQERLKIAGIQQKA